MSNWPSRVLAALVLLSPLAARAQAVPGAAVQAAVGPATDIPACRRNDPGSTRPRVGLVLGGGGARGIAHISVIKELERLHIPIDCIAGTSMGSLVGGMYASGMPIADIEKLILDLDWGDTLNDDIARPDRSFRRKRDDDLSLLPAHPGIGNGGVKLASGLLAGQKVMLLFERITAPAAYIHDFDQLPVPYRAVAADINTGRAVVLSSGSLPAAMRASMSIPGAFRPIEIDGRVLVDGGMVNQVPVDVARAMGADIVIAVDVGTPLSVLTGDSSMLAFANQVTGFLTVGNTNQSIASLGPRDVLIQPDLGDKVTTGGFDKAALALEIGSATMADPAIQAKLAALSHDEGIDSARHLPARARAPPVISFVRFDNTSRYSDAMLLSRLNLPMGQPLDTERLETGILDIYALQTLTVVTYDLIEDNGRNGLLIHVRPGGVGPNYLEAGVTLVSDFQGAFLSNLRLGILHSPLNANGGELRVMAQLGSEHSLFGEFYQPLGTAGHWFAGARVGFDAPQIGRFDVDGNLIATYDLPTFGVNAYAGRNLGRYGALTLGVRRQHGHFNLLSGDPGLEQHGFDIGQASLTFAVDRLDSLYLPRNGYYASIGQTASRRSLGADVDFTQFDLDALYAKAIGAHSAFVGLRYHETIDGLAPIQSQYRLGGVTRLVGVRPNQLTTQNYAMGYLGYTYALGSVLGRPAVLGTTIEYADLWQDGPLGQAHRYETDASAYFGFDSWLGRLILGYGARSNGDGLFFLELGRAR